MSVSLSDVSVDDRLYVYPAASGADTRGTCPTSAAFGSSACVREEIPCDTARPGRVVKEPGPGADVAGVGPVPVQMWQGGASACSYGTAALNELRPRMAEFRTMDSRSLCTTSPAKQRPLVPSGVRVRARVSALVLYARVGACVRMCA